jgi:protein-tyrosine phosphatase
MIYVCWAFVAQAAGHAIFPWDALRGGRDFPPCPPFLKNGDSFAMYTVLFVCSGNTCRSPMAQLLLRQKIEDAKLGALLRALSAGLCAREGDAMPAAAQAAMGKRGIGAGGFCARMVDAGLVEEADIIFTMTAAQLRALAASFPAARGKAFALGDFCGGGGEVPDPFGGGEKEYEACASQLEGLIGLAMEKISGALGEKT